MHPTTTLPSASRIVFALERRMMAANADFARARAMGHDLEPIRRRVRRLAAAWQTARRAEGV
jgi:hypothetical protein